LFFQPTCWTIEAAGAALEFAMPLVATPADAIPLISATMPNAIAANNPYFIAFSLSLELY